MLRSSPTICLLLLSFTGLALLGCGNDNSGERNGSGGASAGQSGTGGAAGRAGASGTGGTSGKGGSGAGGASGGASGAGGASAASGGASGAGGGASGTAGASGTSGGASGGSAGAGGEGIAGAGGGGNAGGGAGGSGAGGTSACGPCNTPPTVCYSLTGTCVQGSCEYTFIEGAACDDGNDCTINDTCTAGACTGTPMACTSPRAPVCLDSTHLQTYDNPGVCSGGRCVYTQQTITCGTGGCANNACQTDPCASVTCSTPPSICYDAAGTCSQGSCSYPPNTAACDDNDPCTDGDMCNGGVCAGVPKLCNTPGPDTCADASTVAVHDHVGTCSAGVCGYTVHYVSCPTGCSGGVCNASGWTSMTSNSNQNLTSVWGTSATSVWAVGMGGTALYYGGVQWQARPTPMAVQSDTLTSLSGTSDSNIFAVGTPGNASSVGTSVLRFDGTSWNFLGRVPIASQYHAACVAAYADNDAFVWGQIYSSSNDEGSLYRVTNGTATLIMSVTSPGFSNQSQCGIQVFSLNDIVATGNFQVFQIDSVAHTATTLGTAALTSQGGALWADSTSDLFITYGASVEQWTGGPAWTSLSTGLAGSLAAISGTSSSRVFAAGYAAATTTIPGTVLYWNGVGWTVQSLPSATPSLSGIWASPLPQGRVFAVGLNGTIVTGP